MPRSDDDDDDDFEPDDPNIQALVGGAPSDGGVGELSDLLMDVMCAATKVKWLIKEASEAEHKVIAERLAELKKIVNSMPDAGRPGKRVGFKGRRK